MMKFSVDVNEFQSSLSKRKMYRLADVQHKIKKVGFDVVRFVDSDRIDDLWRIHRDGDDEYIVAMYDEDLEKTAAQSNIPWRAFPDDSQKNINLYYENIPITRISLSSLGVPAEDAWLMGRTLVRKLASDADFLSSFMKVLSSDEKIALQEANPSLMTTYISKGNNE